MDNVYDKQLSIIKKYEELSLQADINRKEALDLKQELNRQYHILNHHLRAQYNTSGRIAGFIAFSIIGSFLILLKTPAFGGSKIKNLVNLSCVTLGFGLLGYGYSTRFHSSYQNSKIFNRRLTKFREENDHRIIESDKRIEKFLSKI